MRLLKLILIATLLSSFSCASYKHGFYNTTAVQHQPIENQSKEALRYTLSERFDEHTKIVFIDGGVRKEGLNALNLPALAALHMTSSLPHKGAYEADLLVRLLNKPSRAVTVRHLKENHFEIEVGTAPDVRRNQVTTTYLKQSYGLTKVAKNFTRANLQDIEDALTLLPPSVLKPLETVSFVKDKRPPPRANGAALYSLKGCSAEIRLYKRGLDNRFRFAGDPFAPLSANAYTLLHEIGHAFRYANAREAYCKSERARGALEQNRLVKIGNSLGKQNTVLRSYLDALGTAPAATLYGSSSDEESFAESFALFYIDPDALKLLRPSVYDWFKRGTHEKAFASERSRL